MIRVIQGRRYLMRDKRCLTELMKMYHFFCLKYGPTPLHKWLVERGKVYKELK